MIEGRPADHSDQKGIIMLSVPSKECQTDAQVKKVVQYPLHTGMSMCNNVGVSSPDSVSSEKLRQISLPSASPFRQRTIKNIHGGTEKNHHSFVDTPKLVSASMVNADETSFCRSNLSTRLTRLIKDTEIVSASCVIASISQSSETLRCLELLCPYWASYSGVTDQPNRLFHRQQLYVASDLISIFGYYALLHDLKLSLVDSFLNRKQSVSLTCIEDKVVDTFILLDQMRCQHEIGLERGLATSNDHQFRAQEHCQVDRNSITHHLASLSTYSLTCATTTTTSSQSDYSFALDGFSNIENPVVKEFSRCSIGPAIFSDENETNESLSSSNGSIKQSKKYVQKYLPIPREHLKATIRIDSMVVSSLLRNHIGLINQCHAESVEPALFDDVLSSLCSTLNPTADVASIASPSNSDQFSERTNDDTYGSQGVAALLELLDEIREILESPSIKKEQQHISMPTILQTSTTSNQTLCEEKKDQNEIIQEALAWIELANCLSEVITAPSNESNNTMENVNNGRGKRRLHDSSPKAASGKDCFKIAVDQNSLGKRRKASTSGNLGADANSKLPNACIISNENAAQPPPSSSSDYANADLSTPCPGVCWDPTHQRWVAHWSDAKTHQRIRKYFNPKLLGFDRARLLAVLTRKEAVDSGRASMTFKAERPKFVTTPTTTPFPPTTNNSSSHHNTSLQTTDQLLSSTDDPFDKNYIRGVYYAATEQIWYSHWKVPESADVVFEAYPVASFLSVTGGDFNTAMSLARSKAIQKRLQTTAAAAAPETTTTTETTTKEFIISSIDTPPQQLLPPIKVTTTTSPFLSGVIVSDRGYTSPSLNSGAFSSVAPPRLATTSNPRGQIM